MSKIINKQEVIETLNEVLVKVTEWHRDGSKGQFQFELLMISFNTIFNDVRSNPEIFGEELTTDIMKRKFESAIINGRY